MDMISFDTGIENNFAERSIVCICFVGSDKQDILAPLWFYNSAVKSVHLFYSSNHYDDAMDILEMIRNDPVFSGINVSSKHYSKTDTNINEFRQNIEQLIPLAEDNTNTVINISGCSKPVYLSMILFAIERNASIILSVKYNHFEIFEDGAVRIQEYPNKIKWYLSQYKLNIYPKIPADRTKDAVIPEKVLQDKPDLLQEYLMESTITGKSWTLNVDFVCTTKDLLVIGKMFTEDGESFDRPCRIFSESSELFGENCRILVYAAGDDLYRHLVERLGEYKYITVVNIPDPWCLAEYPEYFELDLMKTIKKKI